MRGSHPLYIFGSFRGEFFFLLDRDCLLTKWTLWAGRYILFGTSITLLFASFQYGLASSSYIEFWMCSLTQTPWISLPWPVEVQVTPPRVGKLRKKWAKWEIQDWGRRCSLASREQEKRGSVLSQVCNGQSHRSRNISCQASRTDRLPRGGACGGLDTDYPRSASDDPLETFPCKNTARTLKHIHIEIYV